MTNEQLLDDLKQFIDATVSQHTAELAMRIDGVEQRIGGLDRRINGLEQRIDILDQKIDQVQDAIADTFTQGAEATSTTLREHDARLSRLERRTA